MTFKQLLSFDKLGAQKVEMVLYRAQKYYSGTSNPGTLGTTSDVHFEVS